MKENIIITMLIKTNYFSEPQKHKIENEDVYSPHRQKTHKNTIQMLILYYFL